MPEPTDRPRRPHSLIPNLTHDASRSSPPEPIVCVEPRYQVAVGQFEFSFKLPAAWMPYFNPAAIGPMYKSDDGVLTAAVYIGEFGEHRTLDDLALQSANRYLRAGAEITAVMSHQIDVDGAAAARVVNFPVIISELKAFYFENTLVVATPFDGQWVKLTFFTTGRDSVQRLLRESASIIETATLSHRKET